jgi:hypothetical protein
MAGAFMALIEPQTPIDGAGQFILLHHDDSILVCISTSRAGSTVVINGTAYVLASDILLGHKIARVELFVGDPVLRYGIKIGSMTAAANPGEHIHSHNLKSDYIPAHGRDAVRMRENNS